MFELPVFQATATIRTGGRQWFAEGVATFGLILTIIAVDRFSADRVAAAVGLYILSAYWCTASTSFANPAVTVARTLTNTFAGIAPETAPAIIAAQFAGALIAAVASSAPVADNDQY